MKKMYAFVLLSFILSIASSSYAQSWGDFQNDQKPAPLEGAELKACLGAKYQEYVFCFLEASDALAETACNNVYRQEVESDCYARELSCSEQYSVDYNVCYVSSVTPTSLFSRLYFVQKRMDKGVFQSCIASASVKKNECVNESIIRNFQE